MANAQMSELWNGPDASAWVEAPDRYDAMLADLGRRVIQAADLQPGERVLDVGCGSGALTREAAQRVGPDGRATGVDISAPLLEVARQRSASLSNVDFLHGDAQEGDLRGQFDVLISRFGVMFFEDPIRAFTHLHSAVTGRLAFVCWQPALNNEWIMLAMGALIPHLGMPELPAPGEPSPFAFADPDHTRNVLASGGWRDVQIESVESSLIVGGAQTADDGVAYFREDVIGRQLLGKAEPEKQEAALAALRDAVEPRMTEDGLKLGAAAWLVTAKP